MNFVLRNRPFNIRLAAMILVAVCLLTTGPTAFGILCSECREKVHDNQLGRCRECGANAQSTAFELCPKCSVELLRCDRCYKKFT